MTADELTAELYRQQGFLILNSEYDLPVGYIYRYATVGKGDGRHEWTTQPVRVVDKASDQEFTAQNELAKEILGFTPGSHRGPYNYRVESD